MTFNVQQTPTLREPAEVPHLLLVSLNPPALHQGSLSIALPACLSAVQRSAYLSSVHYQREPSLTTPRTDDPESMAATGWDPCWEQLVNNCLQLKIGTKCLYS